MAAATLSVFGPVPAQAIGGDTGSWIGAFVGALLGEIVGHHFVLRSDQHIQEQLDLERRTDEDEAALKGLATALEEYAVDHDGTFPATLDALRPTYFPRPPWIPESEPPAAYKYENPAARPDWGRWDIVDNGAFDPTMHKLRAADGTACTRSSCTFIIYAESVGLIGAPADYAATRP
jgi:hypothetical protein